MGRDPSDEVTTRRGTRRRQLALNTLSGLLCLGILVGVGSVALRTADARQTRWVSDAWLPSLDLSGHPTMALRGDGELAGAAPSAETETATTAAAAATGDGAATQPAATTPAKPAVVQVASLDQRPRLLGTTADPWNVDTWQKALRAPVDITMTFAAWGVDRDLRGQFAQASRRHLIPMLTWEPWVPVATSLGADAQGAIQPRYANAAIARGRDDAYIRRVALLVRSYPGPVLIRYAHEMNGDWYPWSKDAAGYRLAWRHIVTVFREAGATNARWVWSPNPNFYQTDDADFLAHADEFWPGGSYVDYVGTTMVRFNSGATLDEYWARVETLRAHYHRAMMLTEVNVDFPQRAAFFNRLCERLHAVDWMKAVVISQAPSRGAAINPQNGQMDWQVPSDPTASKLVGAISEAPRCAPAK